MTLGPNPPTGSAGYRQLVLLTTSPLTQTSSSSSKMASISMTQVCRRIISPQVCPLLRGHLGRNNRPLNKLRKLLDRHAEVGTPSALNCRTAHF